MAASVDPREKAQEMVEKNKLTFPIGYGLEAENISELTGAFYEPEKKFIQPTAFLIRPDKTIAVASYSSGPVGRMVAKDVWQLVKLYKSKK